jgi:hypothetical protein
MKDEGTHLRQFQVLTKRSERLAELSPLLEWTENIWMGVSVENEDYVYRIDDLRRTGAMIKFLSVEPLLGPLPKVNLRGINWVIVGGESGQGRVRWRGSGLLACGISAGRRKFLSSSSNGAVSKRRRQAGYSMAGRGMRCQEIRISRRHRENWRRHGCLLFRCAK